MIRKIVQRRRIDDNGILNDGRLTSFIYKINISDGKLTPVSGWFAVGILAHICAIYWVQELLPRRKNGNCG